MGTTYLSRVFYGFVLAEDEFPIPDEVIQNADHDRWLEGQADEHCKITMQMYPEKYNFLVHICDTLQICDERYQQIIPIQIPIVPSVWKDYLRAFSKKLRVIFKEPSWHLTVECW